LFEQAFEKFVEEQRHGASGMRLEMLKSDLHGTKKLLGTVVWPVLQSFEGIILEHEIVSTTGVKIYIDAFYEPIKLSLESEGYVVHAQNITRDRFDFERMRVRTLAMYGYKYIPYTWDELDKKPDACRRSLYELLGRYAGSRGDAYESLTVYERELLRYAIRMNRPIGLNEVCDWLQIRPDACRKVLRKMIEKNLIRALGSGTFRFHEYILVEGAAEYLL